MPCQELPIAQLDQVRDCRPHFSEGIVTLLRPLYQLTASHHRPFASGGIVLDVLLLVSFHRLVLHFRPLRLGTARMLRYFGLRDRQR